MGPDSTSRVSLKPDENMYREVDRTRKQVDMKPSKHRLSLFFWKFVDFQHFPVGSLSDSCRICSKITFWSRKARRSLLESSRTLGAGFFRFFNFSDTFSPKIICFWRHFDENPVGLLSDLCRIPVGFALKPLSGPVRHPEVFWSVPGCWVEDLLAFTTFLIHFYLKSTVFYFHFGATPVG